MQLGWVKCSMPSGKPIYVNFGVALSVTEFLDGKEKFTRITFGYGQDDKGFTVVNETPEQLFGGQR